MKVSILTLTLLFCTITICAQDKLVFNYDTAGNQILREKVCLNCMAQARPEAVMNDSINSQADDPVMEFQLKSYPNPVVDDLYVEWINNPEFLVSKIQLFSNNSQLLLDVAINDKQGEQAISFTGLPLGIYHVVVYYNNNQSRKTFKIIKK